ncbi:MAG: hypothetical protein ACFCUW_06115 [Kiloniellaceae bacterium]
MSRRTLKFLLPLVLLAPATAQAEIMLPDCARMADWAGRIDLRERQALNPSTTLGYPVAFLDAEMAALYGKTGPEFTVEDAAAARQAAKDCTRQVGKAESRVLAGLEKEFARGLGPTLEKMAKAGADLEAGLDAFAAAPPGAEKLHGIAALRALGDWDRDAQRAYNAAVRPIGRDFRRVIDSITRALASLPQTAVAERVLPRVDPQFDESLAMVLADTRQQLDGLEASEQGLRRFDRDAAKIVDPLAIVLPDEARAALDEDVAARKSAIEQELIAAVLRNVDGLPASALGLRQVEQAASGGLVKVVSAEAGDGFLAALRARRQAIALALIESLPAEVQGLLALPDLRGGLGNSPAGLVGDAELAGIDAAIAAKQAAVGEAVARDLHERIAATPVESRAFAELDRYADRRILALLAAEDAEALRQAAERRRDEVGSELFAMLAGDLSEMPDTEQSLAVIDTALLPEIQNWPASAEAQRSRFLEVVVARRNAILASITEAERGPLRGRTYAERGGMTKLEFADGGRAYVTEAGSPTIAAPYEEEGDTRVLVTLPQGTVVFTREGRWLVGGPLQLERIDTAN